MSNNSSELTSTLVKKSFKVVNISVSRFCIQLSQTTSFLLIAPHLFFSTKHKDHCAQQRV